MRCLVTIIRCSTHTLELHLDGMSEEEAKAHVKETLEAYVNHPNWTMQAIDYEVECEPDDGEAAET